MKPSSPKSSGKGKGCLLTALTIAFVIVSGFYFLTAGIRDAKQLEQTLIDRFGWAEDYTPPLDGSIDPQRIEAFIRVREAADCNWKVKPRSEYPNVGFHRHFIPVHRHRPKRNGKNCQATQTREKWHG